jgi:hypothetical protein
MAQEKKEWPKKKKRMAQEKKRMAQEKNVMFTAEQPEDVRAHTGTF